MAFLNKIPLQLIIYIVLNDFATCHYVEVEFAENLITSVENWPFLVNIIDPPVAQSCWGTIVQLDWVLCSAQCVLTKSPKIIFSGITDYESFLTKWTELMETSECVNIDCHIDVLQALTQINDIQINFGASLVHPEFTRKKEKSLHDIALIRLVHPFKLTRMSQPLDVGGISLEDEEICVIGGWAKQKAFYKADTAESDEKLPPHPLYSAYTQKINFFQINETVLKKLGYNSDYFIYTFSFVNWKIVKGFLPGDFGGPLICNGKQYGVSTLNLQKAKPTYLPNHAYMHVFTKLNTYLPWISKTINNQDEDRKQQIFINERGKRKKAQNPYLIKLEEASNGSEKSKGSMKSIKSSENSFDAESRHSTNESAKSSKSSIKQSEISDKSYQLSEKDSKYSEQSAGSANVSSSANVEEDAEEGLESEDDESMSGENLSKHVDRKKELKKNFNLDRGRLRNESFVWRKNHSVMIDDGIIDVRKSNGSFVSRTTKLQISYLVICTLIVLLVNF